MCGKFHVCTHEGVKLICLVGGFAAGFKLLRGLPCDQRSRKGYALVQLNGTDLKVVQPDSVRSFRDRLGGFLSFIALRCDCIEYNDDRHAFGIDEFQCVGDCLDATSARL